MLISHLDLKGVLPRVSYLPQLLQDTAALGFDAILVEYEDVFPFHDGALSAAPEERWSHQTLQNFLAEAARLNLEVIPLQQCLGHFEWIFRWEKYRHFALDKKYPSTIDVSSADAKAFLFGLLDEVLDAHPQSRFIHVGMDEAYALIEYARASRQSVVGIFLDHLEEVCARCEAKNKTPIIWIDMIEHHFSSDSLARFEAFKERVVLCWGDYGANGQRTADAHIDGHRTARAWLDEPQNPQAPPMTTETKWVEDLDGITRDLIAPHFDGRTFAPLFWCDIWTQLGFRVIGTSAARAAREFAVLPNYSKRRANVLAWQEKVENSGALGHLVTSWARGTSWGPPTFSFDLTWPLLEDAARAEGKNPPPFFAGLDNETVARITTTLGRCRVDWKIEIPIADEMGALLPQITAHAFEWQSLSLMARVVAWQKRAAAVQDEVDFFGANTRPVPDEWQRRIDEQAQALTDGAALRHQVAAHFGARYAGDAHEEWLRDVFDVPMDRLKNCGVVARHKMEIARRHYAL